MAQAIDDLETVRTAVGVAEWIVLGHSWGSDLAVRYALDHPQSVRGVAGIAGHGLHRDREWSAAYEAGKASEVAIDIDWVPEVHAALWGSFPDWIHQPGLWRALADSPVPMRFVAAGNDIRPSWPLQQLANLVPDCNLPDRARRASRLLGYRPERVARDVHQRLPRAALSDLTGARRPNTEPRDRPSETARSRPTPLKLLRTRCGLGAPHKPLTCANRPIHTLKRNSTTSPSAIT